MSLCIIIVIMILSYGTSSDVEKFFHEDMRY
jgi:hypothetical protein